jgi:hypothetical protein
MSADDLVVLLLSSREHTTSESDARRLLAEVKTNHSAEQAAEIVRLRAELSTYEVLNPQQCPKGIHADWLVDSEHAHACPWCELEKTQATLAAGGAS